MQQRRGTAAQWTAANPILAAGEIGFETDTNKFKMGNGSSTWTALTYFANAAELAAIIDSAPETLNTLNELAAAIQDDPAFFTTVAANLEAHRTSTGVHGIADTTLLTTVTQVNTAITAAMNTHNNDTTNVHGIVDTSVLATVSNVESAATTAATALSTHSADTTSVHGIADTAELSTKAYADGAVSTHNSDTTLVHGIADTAQLETLTGAQSKADAAAASAVSTHNSDTTLVHGIADTSQLVTQDDLTDAISAAETDFSTFGGTGIDWNAVDNRFDIDSTIATKTYADGAVSTHQDDTTNVHGIADTSALALTATVNSALDLKSNIAGPTFTGTVTVPTLAVTTTATGITKTMVGLGNVDNTADSAKPVSTAQATAIATAKSEAIADATSQVNAVIASAPAALNTLDELAAALGDDANFATTVTNSLAAKAPINAPTFTGTVTVAAAGVAFTDGTQTKAGVPSITTIPTAIAAGAHTLASGRSDQLIPLTGAVVITLPSTGYSTGQSIDFYQESGTGARFESTNGVVATPGRNFRTTNSVVTAMKTASGWLVFGDLSA